jgi:hypothetical protein
VVNVPVANEVPDAPSRQHGNRFSNFLGSLATDVVDPWDRLAAIAASTAEAKVLLDLQGLDTLPRWLDVIPPALGAPGARAMARHSRKDPTTADVNVVVSHVRMPPGDRSLGRAPVERVLMAGPVEDGAGLNITVTSEGTELNVAIDTNPSAADPREVAKRLHAAVEELRAARPSMRPSAPTAAGPSAAPDPSAAPAPSAAATEASASCTD